MELLHFGVDFLTKVMFICQDFWRENRYTVYHTYIVITLKANCSRLLSTKLSNVYFRLLKVS